MYCPTLDKVFKKAYARLSCIKAEIRITGKTDRFRTMQVHNAGPQYPRGRFAYLRSCDLSVEILKEKRHE